VAKDIYFESEAYSVSARHVLLFTLYLGNNPDLHAIRTGKQRLSDRIHGNRADVYAVHGSVTDVVIRPACGPDKYVWMHIVPSHVELAMKAIRSLRCAMHRDPVRHPAWQPRDHTVSAARSMRLPPTTTSADTSRAGRPPCSDRR
jgi:hypothetical protein